jgi:hypothetical protein
VVEWKLNPGNPTGAQRHPLHVHVWPFQIVDLPLQSADHANNYYQVGDFHDTIQIGLEEAVSPSLHLFAFSRSSFRVLPVFLFLQRNILPVFPHRLPLPLASCVRIVVVP